MKPTATILMLITLTLASCAPRARPRNTEPTPPRLEFTDGRDHVVLGGVREQVSVRHAGRVTIRDVAFTSGNSANPIVFSGHGEARFACERFVIHDITVRNSNRAILWHRTGGAPASGVIDGIDARGWRGLAKRPDGTVDPNRHELILFHEGPIHDVVIRNVKSRDRRHPASDTKSVHIRPKCRLRGS